jgi:hypothetical protein
MSRRVRSGVAFAVFAITAWLCWDNVFSDDAEIRSLAEKTACTKQKCDERHGLVRESRNPFGQTIDYQWRDATIRVSCHRAYWVVGERQCAIE